MSTQKHKLTTEDIQRAFAAGSGAPIPVILSPAQLGAVLGISPKTIYEWIAKGRLNGAFRKRGKHHLLWRDRAIDLVFNGKEWTDA